MIENNFVIATKLPESKMLIIRASKIFKYEFPKTLSFASEKPQIEMEFQLQKRPHIVIYIYTYIVMLTNPKNHPSDP